ncbi:hypothetical protein EFB08_01985 [Rufibacter latericius]|uniref:Uncharacterized protein n=1 Tax=Rufibacter latericius TaxID=2487040 RepID=A0A3M9N0J6_9BACT|nr:hypothetical protein EFB08_01985 [Rufibacter latericius]
MPALLGALLVTSCETTPRERKEIASRELEKLDEKANAAAVKTKDELKEAGKALARQRAERKAREARGPVAGKQAQMERELLGQYRILSQVPADSLRDAYVYFLQQVRDRKEVWTTEDWDYANNIYKRLNDRERALHDDIILRHATKIRALQAEYVTLENKADLRDYQRIKKEQGQ